jgi:hypothetical protein
MIVKVVECGKEEQEEKNGNGIKTTQTINRT